MLKKTGRRPREVVVYSISQERRQQLWESKVADWRVFICLLGINYVIKYFGENLVPSNLRFYGLLACGFSYLLYAEWRLSKTSVKFLVDKITLDEYGTMNFNRFVPSRVFSHISLMNEQHARVLSQEEADHVYRTVPYYESKVP